MTKTSHKLVDVFPDLERLLKDGDLPLPKYGAADVRCQAVMVPMRDGVRLATDIYLPPRLPAPVIVIRTPYGRAMEMSSFAGTFHSYARRGYVVVSQDCRGTGDSEPEAWDYYMFEVEDGYDCVEWITRQSWFGGFIGSFGGSYVGQTQWCMALHPSMSTIVPSVSGLGIASNTLHQYMFLNAFAFVIGKGKDKLSIPMNQMERHFEKQTMAGGFFNEPLHKPLSSSLLARFPNLRQMTPLDAKKWLWSKYASMSCAERAQFVKQAMDVEQVTIQQVESLPEIFGQHVSHDALTIPHDQPAELCGMVRAAPLMRTGWYDWCLNDAFATWEALRRHGRPEIARRARMIITAYAHNAPGYHVASDTHPELLIPSNALSQAALLLSWYEAVRTDTVDEWPTITYYMMGANEWRAASDWPVPEAEPLPLYLGSNGSLSLTAPEQASPPDCYTYDPYDPTPTVGGSIVSYVYRPGSVDVRKAQARPDVLVYTTAVLQEDLEVVGPLRMILYASSSAADTDFVVRLSDVFPDGRAIQLQSGTLRARYRNLEHGPQLLEPGRIYRFEIDMWATANTFKAGHCVRIDISSADFPHFDRNSNRGGEPGEPVPARQSIYRDPEHPSYLVLPVLGRAAFASEREAG